MEWQDEAYVLSARAHGETGAVVHLLTRSHGLFAAHVAGGASRKMRPWLQAGARVMADYRARSADHLGGARLEPIGEGPSALFDDPLALAGLASAAAIAHGALPEREPHEGAFEALSALSAALSLPDIWPAVYIRYELGLLDALGFGLDLSQCAATGSILDLVYVSPRTGRAVSRSAGAPFEDRLLGLPPFLTAGSNPLRPGDIGMGLRLTGYFLDLNVFQPLHRPLPPARVWLVDKLQAAGRL